MKIKIKYFNNAKKLEKISKGDWIDVYANESMYIKQGENALIPLGIAMELPEGYEAHLAPRSSTFKNWGLIVTNSFGVIDNSYCGDNDEWKLAVYCLKANSFVNGISCTKVEKGDKIAQFRIIETMPPIEFEEVETLGNEDRNGFGSTGTN